jgi:DNA polymerase III subunit epsilon
VAYLEAGPAASGVLVRDVFGLVRPRPPRAIADRLVATLLESDPRVGRTADGRWTLAQGALESPALEACRFAVVDVEATGRDPGRGGRVIELAVATLDGAEPRLVYETLVDPEQPVAAVVLRLTGIAPELLARAPRFASVADQVLAALSGGVFVAHHVRFDWAFVAAELARTRGLLLTGPRLCTVRLARRLLPPLESRNLDALAHYFGFAIERRHRAGPDAMAAARILARLLGIARDRGARTLADLSIR